MYVLIGRLAQYGLHRVQDLWNEHGDEIIDAGQAALETIWNGAETIIENLGDIF